MRKISDIYKEYKIIPNLQLHQLRVAAVGSQICESLTVEEDMQTLIIACLLHDMGNVIKFDFTQTQSIFGLSDSEIQPIKKIQSEFIEKYGNNEHTATIDITRELGVSDKIIELVSKNSFNNLYIDKDGNDFALKILHYADARVGPNGVLSYDERMDDAKARYQNRKGALDETERAKLVACGREIEKQIFSLSKIKPEDISDESTQSYIEKLKGFEI